MAALPGEVKRRLPEHVRIWYRRKGEPHGVIKSDLAVTVNEVMERLSRVYKAINGREFEHVLIRPDGLDMVETQVYMRPSEHKRFLHDVQQYLFTLEQP